MNYTEQDINKIKNTAQKLNFSGSLKTAIFLLEQAKQNNKNVYIEFNDVTLYSLLDNEQSCYKKILKFTDAQLMRNAHKHKYPAQDIEEVEEILTDARNHNINIFMEFENKNYYSMLNKDEDFRNQFISNDQELEK